MLDENIKEKISDELLEIAEKVLFHNKQSIDIDTELFGGGSGLGSLKLIELVFAVEKKYQIEFDPKYMQGEYFSSVATLTETVLSILESKQ
ncbi:phosphopantetheine-binding protein [Spartinivicinus poritis]|uniref:Phosphopantetheine-binding protein n=1 Tax=Spartinivicinus poritis TaxID=2994640 RepID=A0ABT5U822_9GAMM|nr:phosphopantetheine-binding protein [Spartinivicinus sp. A2-2]MDE1462519.1 phosphopantetheine-binding protein [Spartinivicinus sp. A2-2]